MRQHGFTSIAIALLVLVIIGIGGTIYYLTQTQNKQPVTTVKPEQTAKPISVEAIDLLTALPEIQTIEKSVIKAGRKPFFTPEGESGDIVTVSLRESFPDDPHTSRIDTFNVNIKSKVITVEDVVTGKTIPLEEWKETVKERFE